MPRACSGCPARARVRDRRAGRRGARSRSRTAGYPARHSRSGQASVAKTSARAPPRGHGAATRPRAAPARAAPPAVRGRGPRAPRARAHWTARRRSRARAGREACAGRTPARRPTVRPAKKVVDREHDLRLIRECTQKRQQRRSDQASLRRTIRRVRSSAASSAVYWSAGWSRRRASAPSRADRPAPQTKAEPPAPPDERPARPSHALRPLDRPRPTPSSSRCRRHRREQAPWDGRALAGREECLDPSSSASRPATADTAEAYSRHTEPVTGFPQRRSVAVPTRASRGRS